MIENITSADDKKLPETPETDSSLSFEDAMTRLEEIVHSLESDKTPLDASLRLFEEGVSLVKLCNSLLDSASSRVTILTRSPESGKIDETDFK